MEIATTADAKPFLKWAGGKGQLLDDLDDHLPPALKNGEITQYVEPFIGGGAVFFHVVQRYPIEHAYISDINPEVILVYRTLKRDVDGVVELLREMEENYLPLSRKERKRYYYNLRDQFNAQLPTFDFDEVTPAWRRRAARFIFMNRTCFNGLFRVNSKGEFNVPMGSYRNPTICNGEVLRDAASVLQRAEIHRGDFESCADVVDKGTFVYFDPPYRPISQTSSFNAYSKRDFDDAEQLRLARFYRQLDGQGAKLMLSNSDPKNEDPDDDFFEEAYEGFRIERVQARRAINSKGTRRGEISELLIMNYST